MLLRFVKPKGVGAEHRLAATDTVAQRSVRLFPLDELRAECCETLLRVRTSWCSPRREREEPSRGKDE